MCITNNYKYNMYNKFVKKKTGLSDPPAGKASKSLKMLDSPAKSLRNLFFKNGSSAEFSASAGGTVGLLLLSLTMLTACSTASEHFDTEATQGVGAKSISQVNAMIDKGEIPGIKAGGDAGDTNTVITPILSTAPLPHERSEPIMLSDNTVIHRQPEKVMRIWIAPFQDASGNFYEASVVHSLQRPSFWTAQMLAPSAASYVPMPCSVDMGTES